MDAQGSSMVDVTASVSSSHPAVSRAGEGDFTVIGGGNKTVMYVVVGVVAVAFIGAVVWAVSRIRKKKKR